MKVNNLSGMLGDCLLVEPAIAAWRLERGRIPSMYVRVPEFRCLFNYHNIFGGELIRSHLAPLEGDDVVVPHDSSAFAYASSRGLPFAAGYFPQFGLNPNSGHRLHYDSGIDWEPDEFTPYACVCPNAKSCNSHRGLPANIRPSVEWWALVIAACGLPVYNLGARGDLEIPGTIPIHGLPLVAVAHLMAKARFVISVETGLLHLAGGIRGLPVIFLSCATPPGFADPIGAKAVRAPHPANLSQALTIDYIKELEG